MTLELHGRLAAWVDRRLLPAVLIVLVAVDVAVGLVWLLSDPARFASPAYDVAKLVAPMYQWGTVFLVAATAAGVALWAAGRRWASGYLVGPVCGGLWTGWAVFFTLGAWGRPGSSLFGAVLALGMTALHLLAGLAVTHRPALAP